jgi:hypothetical protein
MKPDELQDDPDQPFNAEAFGQGMRASHGAGSRWTDTQKAQVDLAIEWVATTNDEFTTDDVWRRLWTRYGDDFPVTKGIAGRLNKAAREGRIRTTGRVRFAQRGGEHDHRQRLSVWQAGGTK